MEKKTIRIGLLGFGSMGRTHTWAVRNLPFFYGSLPFEAITDTVFTTTVEKSRRVAEEFSIPRFTADMQEIFSNSEIDVVDICTPNNCHFDNVKAALLAGKHVLCEKPLAINPEQALELARLAKESGKVCGMEFNYRWLAPVLRAKQLIDAGRLGKILRFSVKYLHNSCIDPERTKGWKQDKTVCGAGTLFDLGSHAIDLVLHLCGNIQSVSGCSQIAFPYHPDAEGNLWQTNADEAFDMICVTEEGAHGTISVSKISQGANDELAFEISGESGALHFSLMDPNFLYFYDTAAPNKPQGGDRGFTAVECVGRYPDMIFPSPKAPAGWLYSHLASMEAFLSAVAGNKPFSPSISEGAKVQCVMDAALRSDENHGAFTEVKPCL